LRRKGYIFAFDRLVACGQSRVREHDINARYMIKYYEAKKKKKKNKKKKNK
jgi:hypothetical protein